MTNRIQFKSFKMENIDHDSGTVEGYASTYGNVDKANDVVLPGAFKKALLNGPERVRFLWEHKRTEVIGVITEMREDANGLYIKAQFGPTQRAQETRELMKMGAVDSFSIGYRVLQEGPGNIRGKSVNLLKEIQLLEVSCVAWPCNVEARMTAVKSDIEDRFADLPLDHQALVSKFLDMLEAETKDATDNLVLADDGRVIVDLDAVDELDADNFSKEDWARINEQFKSDEDTNVEVTEEPVEEEDDASDCDDVKSIEELFEAFALVETLRRGLRD